MDKLPLNTENLFNICIDDVSERNEFEMEYKSEKTKKTVAFYGGKTFYRIRKFRKEYGLDLISVLQTQQTQPAPMVNPDLTDNTDERQISVCLLSAQFSTCYLFTFTEKSAINRSARFLLLKEATYVKNSVRFTVPYRAVVFIRFQCTRCL